MISPGYNEQLDAKGESALIRAIRAGARSHALELATAGANLSARSANGTPVISIAIIQNEIEITLGLLSLAAKHGDLDSVNAPDSQGETPLIHAIRRGGWALSTELAQAGANLGTHNAKGYPAISFAILRNERELLRSLLQIVAKNGDSSCLLLPDPNGEEPLIHAIRAGWTTLASEMVQAGADLCACTKKGQPAITLAVLEGNRDLVRGFAAEALQAKDPTSLNLPDSKGESPLIHAIRSGWTTPAMEMVQAGSELSACNHKGQPAFTFAILEGNRDLVRDLAAHARISNDPVPLNIPDKKGETPLIHAIRAGWSSAAMDMIQAGADPSACSASGAPSVTLAILQGDRDLSFAMANHAKRKGETLWINLPDANGETPLIHAIRAGWTSVADELAQAGASLSCCDKKGTPALSAAILEGNKDLVLQWSKLAKTQGDTSPLDLPDAKGEAPLIHALRAGWTTAAFALLQAGAKHSAWDAKGHSALDLAVANRMNDIVSILKACDDKQHADEQATPPQPLRNSALAPAPTPPPSPPAAPASLLAASFAVRLGKAQAQLNAQSKALARALSKPAALTPKDQADLDYPDDSVEEEKEEEAKPRPSHRIGLK